MTEKFVVLFQGEESESLGLVDPTTGEAEFLPPLPDNISVVPADSWSGDYYLAVGYGDRLAILVESPSEYGESIKSLLIYSSSTDTYIDGVSDLAYSLFAAAEIPASDPRLLYNVFQSGWSFKDAQDCLVWLVAEDGAWDSQSYVFTINIITLEIQLIHTLPYIGQTHYTHEKVSMVTKNYIALTSGGFGQYKLFSRENTEVPVLNPSLGRYARMLSVNEDGSKVLWYAVDGDDYQQHLMLSDLALGEDTILQEWFSDYENQPVGPALLDKAVLSNAETAEIAVFGKWVNSSGISAFPFPSNTEVSKLTYFSDNTSSAIVHTYNYDTEKGATLIIRKDGTYTDLTSLYPNNYMAAICTWNNTPESPRAFWTAFNNAKETI